MTIARLLGGGWRPRCGERSPALVVRARARPAIVVCTRAIRGDATSPAGAVEAAAAAPVRRCRSSRACSTGCRSRRRRWCTKLLSFALSASSFCVVVLPAPSRIRPSCSRRPSEPRRACQRSQRRSADAAGAGARRTLRSPGPRSRSRSGNRHARSGAIAFERGARPAGRPRGLAGIRRHAVRADVVGAIPCCRRGCRCRR